MSKVESFVLKLSKQSNRVLKVGVTYYGMVTIYSNNEDSVVDAIRAYKNFHINYNTSDISFDELDEVNEILNSMLDTVTGKMMDGLIIIDNEITNYDQLVINYDNLKSESLFSNDLIVFAFRRLQSIYSFPYQMSI